MDGDIRTRIMEHLSGGVGAARDCFDAATGRFLAENGGWAVTQQDVIYPLALLYVTEHPGNGFFGDAEILELACRGGDALRDRQDEEGRFEFIKPNGQRWGRVYMPWSMYHWLEAFALLRDRLSAERAAAWEKGLRLAFAGTSRIHGDAEKVHNIATWHCMALVRAGQILEEPRWREIGARYIRHAAASQDPAGYWPEGMGPTVAYNLVYVHSIGLYCHFTGDESVAPALERALDFHLRFTYPNGAPVETIDGRCKYSDRPIQMGPPGFVVRPRGRRFVRFLTERIRRHRPRGELVPHLASAFVHIGDGPEAPIPQEKEAHVAVHHGRAVVRRNGPWFYCMSGYVMPTDALWENWTSRWRMDRQNLVSVWHDELGLAIGGGSSKGQPEFSTFAVQEGRVRWLQPCESAVSAGDGNGDRLELAYGSVKCTLVVRVISTRELELGFTAAGGGDATRVYAGLTLRPCHGTIITATDSAEPRAVDPEEAWRVHWPADHGSRERRVRGAGWELELPDGSRLAWPVYPFNPYNIDGSAPPAEAVLRVSVQLEGGSPAKRVKLKVKS